ncbi:hypothetical protein FGO68_gene1528 [Halteria grandinella]|uniref:Uncharacterized protein n=1 Tax=Halteria grandinella TaxID=5974 RepID=A0A8J8SVW1_HALGN|nr:hypothetical protein FGO68_gene1528 [Halteria grandinella]
MRAYLHSQKGFLSFPHLGYRIDIHDAEYHKAVCIIRDPCKVWILRVRCHEILIHQVPNHEHQAQVAQSVSHSGEREQASEIP